MVVTGTQFWRTTHIYISTHPIQYEKCQACDDDIWFCVPSDEYFHPLRSTEQAKVDQIMGEAGLANASMTKVSSPGAVSVLAVRQVACFSMWLNQQSSSSIPVSFWAVSLWLK